MPNSSSLEHCLPERYRRWSLFISYFRCPANINSRICLTLRLYINNFTNLNDTRACFTKCTSIDLQEYVKSDINSDLGIHFCTSSNMLICEKSIESLNFTYIMFSRWKYPCMKNNQILQIGEHSLSTQTYTTVTGVAINRSWCLTLSTNPRPHSRISSIIYVCLPSVFGSLPPPPALPPIVKWGSERNTRECGGLRGGGGNTGGGCVGVCGQRWYMYIRDTTSSLDYGEFVCHRCRRRLTAGMHTYNLTTGLGW